MRNNCPQTVLENFFEPCTLLLLSKKEGYGYEIQKRLKEQCICEVNTGNLYRCLNRLNRQGYIKRKKSVSAIGPLRYTYTITPSGTAYLDSWINSLKTQKKMISKLITSYYHYYDSNQSG